MRVNLLLAEDNDSTQRMVELIFENENVEVTACSDGNEALKKVQSDIPDIVMADTNIPGLNGMELCRKIKDDPLLKTIPVLLLVNSSEDFDEEKTKEVKADGFIIKPVKSDELIEKVADLTGIKIENDNGDEKDEGDDVPLKLGPEDEVSDEDIEEIAKSVEIFPEEILEDDEKDIDFSDILKDDMDEEDIKKEEYGSGMEKLSAGSKNIDTGEEKVKPYDYKAHIENIKNGAGEGSNREVLSKLLGDQMQIVIENILKDITRDVLAEAVEKTIKEALEKSFADISPNIVKIIEDISWEIIPDLAEVLIKKEIEKLKKDIGTND